MFTIELDEPRPVAASCDETHLVVTLADGRTLRAPLCSYPRLKRASARQRKVLELSPIGVHWPEIDQDISVARLLEDDGSAASEGTTRELAGGLSLQG
jgi:hypothetical protein